MTGYDVGPDDMTRALMIDDKLNRLLAGREIPTGDELSAELAHVLVRVHQAFPPAVVSEQIEDAHIARIMETAASLPAAETAMIVTSRPSFMERIRRGLSRRVAVATVALSTAFGGAAYAGALPEPLQRAVATLAAMVGIDLPNGDDSPGERLPVTDPDNGNTINPRSPDDDPSDEGQSGGKDGDRTGDDDNGSGGSSGHDNPARQPDEDDDEPGNDRDDDDRDDETSEDDQAGDDRDDETDDPDANEDDEGDEDEPENGGASNDDLEEPETEDPSDSADDARDGHDEQEPEDAGSDLDEPEELEP